MSTAWSWLSKMTKGGLSRAKHKQQPIIYIFLGSKINLSHSSRATHPAPFPEATVSWSKAQQRRADGHKKCDIAKPKNLTLCDSNKSRIYNCINTAIFHPGGFRALIALRY